MTIKPHLLIDGDMLVYTLGYASENRGTFADGAVFKQSDLGLAIKLIEARILDFCKKFKTTSYALVMSGSGNWRFAFYPAYKANRVTLEKPLCYHEIRDWMRNLEAVREVNGEEADDYIADGLTFREHGFQFLKGDVPNFIAITADKDFFTVPGRIYHLPSGRLYHPSIPQALCFLFFQALNGDRVDGYYGVRWMGERKNKRLLQACQRKSVRAAYLFIKSHILKRAGKDRAAGMENWRQFRLCLDLAALRWNGEVGSRGIGLRRVWRYRKERFNYFLPYYDLTHNVKYGKVIK